MKLKTLMGEHAIMAQFKTRTDRLDFVECKGSAAPFFKRVVRAHEFDVAEMAIVTYLIAKGFGTPYRLLPIAILARYQHPYLVYCPEQRPGLRPENLRGKTLGVRSYSVTTGVWTRGVLMNEYGLDNSKVTWLVDDEEHVCELKLPPNVVHTAPGKSLVSMMQSGEIQAGFTSRAGIGRQGVFGMLIEQRLQGVEVQ